MTARVNYIKNKNRAARLSRSAAKYAASGANQEEAGFHQAMAENPNDKNALAVYADWLEERGGRPGYAHFLRRVASSPWPHIDRTSYSGNLQAFLAPNMDGVVRVVNRGGHIGFVGYQNAAHGPKEYFIHWVHVPAAEAPEFVRQLHEGGADVQGEYRDIQDMVDRWKEPRPEAPATQGRFARAARKYAMRLEHVSAGAQAVHDSVIGAVSQRMQSPEEAAHYRDAHFHASALADELENQDDPRSEIVRRHAEGLGSPYSNKDLSHSVTALFGHEGWGSTATTPHDGLVPLPDGSHAGATLFAENGGTGRHVVSLNWHIPVVGRRLDDGKPSSLGFHGNFTEEEALDLARRISPDLHARLTSGLEKSRAEAVKPRHEREWIHLARGVKRYAAYRAPAGGIVVPPVAGLSVGQFFKGGEMIPDLQKLSKSDKVKRLRETWKARSKKVCAPSGGSTNREDYSGGNGSGSMPIVSYARSARRYAAQPDEPGYRIQEDQGDGFKITTPHGYIQYRPVDGGETNEIWYVESNKKGHGSELVDLMQKHHPASSIAWGALSQSGRGLMEKWHRNHPDVEMIDGGAFEGQFDPFGNDHEDEDEDDSDLDDLDEDSVDFAKHTPVKWKDDEGVLHDGELTGVEGSTATVTKDDGKKATLDLMDSYSNPPGAHPGEKIPDYKKMIGRYARVRRMARSSDEIRPFAQQAHADVTAAIRDLPDYDYETLMGARQTTAQSLQDFLDDVGDPRAELVRQGLDRRSDLGDGPIYGGSNNYDFKALGDGTVSVGWWPRKGKEHYDTIDHGFFGVVPADHARSIADLIEDPFHRREAHAFLDRHIGPRGPS